MYQSDKVRKLAKAWSLFAKRDWAALKERLQPYGLDWLIPKIDCEFPPPAHFKLTNRADFFLYSAQTLDRFLEAESRLRFPDCDDQVEVTVLLVLFNKAELTYRCLNSLAAVTAGAKPFRILIVDNASSDETSALLSRVEGVSVIRNSENLGFLRACNQALEHIRTPYTLFLNNDTIIHHGSIDAARAVFDEEPDAGAVGGPIVLIDGNLQEAGNFIWRDGTCQSYGRGSDPYHGEFMFRRETDYCSGAFLMTPTPLLKELGGFDDDYAPAYYEEADYCVRLQQRGKKIYYEPRALVEHVEFGSAELSAHAFQQMTKNRGIFVKKHQDYLARKPEPMRPTDPRLVRLRRGEGWQQRAAVLVIDDRAPHPHIGAGFPRAHKILLALHSQGFELTFYPTTVYTEGWSSIHRSVPRDVEFCTNYGFMRLAAFLKSRLNYYQAIWISRPHNMLYMMDHMRGLLESFTGKIIYDAESIFSARDALEKKFRSALGSRIYRSKKYDEFEAAALADVVVSVAPYEAKVFEQKCRKPVCVVGHEFDYCPTPAQFHERTDIVFLGSFHSHPTPNSDSVIWFLEQVLPAIKAKISGIRLHLVGHNRLTKEWQPYLPDVEIVGQTEDLAAALNRYRIMIIPTRYAAGIPQKTFDAAAHGIPTVCSPLISEQMHWTDGEECLVGSIDEPRSFAEKCIRLYEDRDLWERIRNNVITHAEEQRTHHSTEKQVIQVLNQIGMGREGQQ